MANFETQLNSRIIRDGRAALQIVLNFGITLDDFRSSEGKGMYQHLLAYYNDKASGGSIPGVHAASILFPNFELCDDPGMATHKLCEELRRQRKVLEAREVASRLAEECERDPMKALSECQSRAQALLALDASQNTDVMYDRSFDDILFEYEQIEAGIDLSKMSWPWPALQGETMGIQDEDYIVFYGRPKSKKSWVLSYLIAWAHEQQKNVLVYTKEMTPKNIYKRVSACLAHIPYREFRKGKLAPADRANLFALREYAQELKHSRNFVCLSGQDVQAGGDTIPWLRSKVEKYKPDIMFVDGLYLLSSTDVRKNASREERMTTVSRGFRQLILDTHVPGVATLQANRKAAGHSNAELDEIAYSDAIGQDATIAARVIAENRPVKIVEDGEEREVTNTIALVFGGSREFEMHGLRIGGEPAVDFREKGLLSEKEITKAKERDVAGEEADNAANMKKPKRTPVPATANKKAQDALLDKQVSNIP
jgi:hypothetical protein